jgi:uncharacterized protein (DUF1499 family)
LSLSIQQKEHEMRFMLFMLLALVIALAAVVAAGMWRHPQEDWRVASYLLLFGPPDTRPVDFASLVRRTSPNDALACPEGLCRVKVDLITPALSVSTTDALSRLEAAMFARPEAATKVSETINGTVIQRVYLIRTPLMRFPDVLQLRLEEKDGKTLVALYSASQIGYGDQGANRARIEALLRSLDAQP